MKRSFFVRLLGSCWVKSFFFDFRKLFSSTNFQVRQVYIIHFRPQNLFIVFSDHLINRYSKINYYIKRTHSYIINHSHYAIHIIYLYVEKWPIKTWINHKIRNISAIPWNDRFHIILETTQRYFLTNTTNRRWNLCKSNLAYCSAANRSISFIRVDVVISQHATQHNTADSLY